MKVKVELGLNVAAGLGSIVYMKETNEGHNDKTSNISLPDSVILMWFIYIMIHFTQWTNVTFHGHKFLFVIKIDASYVLLSPQL